jgi:hypothetical protein
MRHGARDLSAKASPRFVPCSIDGQSDEMAVDLQDINGVSVFSRTLQPR